MKMSGLRMRSKENPLDFKAVSSLCSDKFPRAINEESKIAKGKASGTIPAETYKSNSRITQALSPLPIKSSIYTQKNCNMSMNIEISKVTTNGPVNDFKLNNTRRFKRKF